MREEDRLETFAQDDERGYCVMEWDGFTWHPVPGGEYCIAPNVPPDEHFLPPDGSPGTWQSFPCVGAFGEVEELAVRSAGPPTQADPAEPDVTSAAVVGRSATALPYPPIATYNLIYHVFPNAGNNIWLRNVRQLRRRLQIFNGRRIVAIATGRGLVHPAQVQAAIAWPGVEYLTVPNDAEIGEVASFPSLLAAVRSTDPGAATFYAHTKGASNTRDDPLAIEYWRNAMYAALLDDPPAVERSLRQHAAVGACKIVHPHMLAFPSRIRWGHWHFAGTFFWFRHDRIFGDFRWPFVPHDRWGVEAWLGGFLAPQEAHSLLQPRCETDYTWNAYDRQVWTAPIPDPLPGNDVEPMVFAVGSECIRRDLRISVIIPCKGRLEHLRQTLPYWLRQQKPPAEIIVVDDDCPDGSGDWVCRTYPDVRVVRGAGGPFNLCRCRNSGAAAASGDFLSFADADFVAPPDYLVRVAAEANSGHDLICIAHYDSGELALNGTCSVSAELYHRVGGYDETHPTYGFEDTDFYGRCRAAGASLGYLHNCQCLPHSDQQRMRFYPERDKAAAMARSAAWLAQRSAVGS